MEKQSFCITYASSSKARKEPRRRALATGNPLAIKMKDPEVYLEVVIAGKKCVRIALEVPSRCHMTLETLTVLERKAPRTLIPIGKDAS